MAHDTIGLIHPESIWHEDSKRLIGSVCTFNNLRPSHVSGWYAADIQSDKAYIPSITIDAFRPRRVK